jgi:hypothetical protein
MLVSICQIQQAPYGTSRRYVYVGYFTCSCNRVQSRTTLTASFWAAFQELIVVLVLRLLRCLQSSGGAEHQCAINIRPERQQRHLERPPLVTIFP